MDILHTGCTHCARMWQIYNVSYFAAMQIISVHHACTIHTTPKNPNGAHSQGISERELLTQPSPLLTFFGAQSTNRKPPCVTLASLQKDNYSGKFMSKHTCCFSPQSLCHLLDLLLMIRK